MKTMLILGNDRIAKNAINEFSQINSIITIIDKSTSLKRLFKLLLNRKLKLSLIIKMIHCEYKREPKRLGSNEYLSIRNNKDLLRIINETQPNKIILFRAGLIINNSIINTKVPLMNIHCARVPEYGGIGSIYRALKNKDINQCATLHQVTETIDKGKVYD